MDYLNTDYESGDDSGINEMLKRETGFDKQFD
jgi:hypothetical protein